MIRKIKDWRSEMRPQMHYSSREYFIEWAEGTLVDTKPVIAVAHARRFGGDPLKASPEELRKRNVP